jgi:hypothetical protein
MGSYIALATQWSEQRGSTGPDGDTRIVQQQASAVVDESSLEVEDRDRVVESAGL